MANTLTGAAAGYQAALDAKQRILNLQVTQSELASRTEEAANQRRFMEAMQKLGSTDMSQDPAGKLDKMAQIALESGQVNKAAEFADRSAMVKARMAQLAHTNMQMEEQKLAQGKKTVNLVAQLMQGATDQDSWDRANALYASTTGQRSPYEGLPYNPRLVQELQVQALTAKEAAELDVKTRNQATLDAVRSSSIDFRNKRLDLLERELLLRKQRMERLGKVGGKVVAAPAKGEVEEAAMLIHTDYDNLPEEEIARNAYVVASRARALRTANPGLDAHGSMVQAMQELNLQNPPGFLDRVYAIFGAAKPPTKATIPSAPMPLPADKKLVVGQVYATPRGNARWNGKQFEAVTQPLVPGIPDAESAAEDLSEEGEE